MCTGLEIALFVGAAAGAASTMSAAEDREDAAHERAQQEREAAEEQAKRIREATRRQVGAARAAMAASGTKLDDFSTINTNEIEQLGGSDVAMTLITGSRRARTIERSANDDQDAAMFDAMGGLVGAGANAYSGWKGRKKG